MASNTFTLIKGDVKILAAAQKLSKLGGSYAKQLHQILCSALAHVQEHGNTTVVENVYQTIDHVTDRYAVDRWIRGCTNMSYRAVGEVRMYRKPASKALVIRLDDAIATPFWKYKRVGEVRTPRPVDVEQRIVIFVRSLLTQIDRGVIKTDPLETKAMAVERAKRVAAALKDFVVGTLKVPPELLAPPGTEEEAKAQEEVPTKRPRGRPPKQAPGPAAAYA